LAQQAELIVVNGRVLTMHAARPRAEAVAVYGGRIVAVGDNRTVRDLAGPTTKVVDAGGATVVPGFIEAHMHIFSGATELAHLHLGGVLGFEALRDAVRAYAASRPDAPMLMAQSVDYAVLGDGRRVTRHDLDAIMSDRPFAMAAADHHTVWANTKALQMAGILRGRAVAPGNEIVMAEDGLAEGELREGEAFTPVLALAGEERSRLGLSTGGEPDPAPSAAERAGDRDIMRRGLAWCARHGITSFHNMDGNLYQMELLSELEAEGDLICRARIPFHFKSFMPLAMLDRASAMTARFRSDRLRSGLVKMFHDGVIDSWTAVMLEPYADRPDWRGDPLFTPEHFRAAIVEADRRGLQVAVHAIGDGAVRDVLDACEAARGANGVRDSRHRVEHIEVTTDADIPRFAGLGVIASMQPTHPPGSAGFPLEPTASRIGRDRWHVSYASGTIRDTGAHVVFASDWPVAPIDPLLGIQAAMLRKPWAEGLPDERFDLHQGLYAYTVEGAYAEFAESFKGAIRPGYLADIAVLSRDAEATAPEDLHKAAVATTICGGEITYQA